MQIYLVQRCILYISFTMYTIQMCLFSNVIWIDNDEKTLMDLLNMLVLSHKSQALVISRRDYCQSVIILWMRLMDMANIRQFNEFIWQFTFTRQLTTCHHVHCMSIASDHITSYRISNWIISDWFHIWIRDHSESDVLTQTSRKHKLKFCQNRSDFTTNPQKEKLHKLLYDF